MGKKLLEIKDLYVNAETKEILKGINLTINKGEIHVIMGPNGSGKSTTANEILSNPEYKKASGKIMFDGVDITDKSTDEIARMGVFMSFQSPEEIPGVSVTKFLKYAKNKITGEPVKIFEFKKELKKDMEEFKVMATAKSVVNPNVLREGIVLRDPTCDLSFKNVSREFLMKHQDDLIGDAE